MNEVYLAILMCLGLAANVFAFYVLVSMLYSYILKRRYPPTKKTVHCRTCIHYKVERITELDCKYYCTHRSNTVQKKNWKDRWDVYKKSPRRLNRHMDCPNYENWDDE